jgi:hypothetical protein
MKRSIPDELVRRHLSRRRLLQAAGLAAAASPVFFGRGAATAQAATGSPLRLVCWPMMNGAESQFFYPGGQDAATLSMITEPIRKYAELATFIKGLRVDGSENHFAVRATYSGGAVANYDSPDPVVTSVDQLIANKIATDAPTPVKSVHLGVIPADSIQYYHNGRNKFFYAPKPVDYEANPVTAYDRLFGDATTPDPQPTSKD